MAADYGYVGVFLIVGVLFVILNVEVLSRLLRPKRPTPEKLTTYECGEEPIGGSWIRFHVRYYLYALVYIVFAVEVIFLYPWAVIFKDFIKEGLGALAFLEMLVFIIILLLGFIYAWRKGALEWV
ncbi:MAG: NADH-quinone oxidoreductase subunit A [candidate division NC10 bacterium]|nr:NADH-quinone oxidoreductase subunit A [candidate division NC10 bacterium]